MHLPTDTCTQVVLSPQGLQSMQGPSFSCFQLPLLDKSVCLLSPTQHTPSACCVRNLRGCSERWGQLASKGTAMKGFIHHLPALLSSVRWPQSQLPPPPLPFRGP